MCKGIYCSCLPNWSLHGRIIRMDGKTIEKAHGQIEIWEYSIFHFL